MDVSATGIGHRCYEVRRALGPDPRHELPQRAFAELLNTTAEVLLDPADRPRYDSSVIARIEKGDRRATIVDAVLMAEVDPMRRGLVWLVIGEERERAGREPEVIPPEMFVPAETSKLLAAKRPAAKKRRA